MNLPYKFRMHRMYKKKYQKLVSIVAQRLISWLAWVVAFSAHDRRASITILCPKLAAMLVAIGNDLEKVLEIHCWHTCEPMHETLEVRFAADSVIHALKETGEERFSLPCAACACD
mmetsp:Transcript_111307/g.203937  ORF Transcript_111307/g.203937 Transcript_111307/m.203937 type:complete len:116 (-) Transcript_111307:95-442(-)